MSEPHSAQSPSFATPCRLRALVSLAVIVPAGFCSKFYSGPGANWVNGELGGFFYELFWCLVVLLLGPHFRPGRIAGGVLLVTCLLEFLQLWHPPVLEWVRGFFIGRTIIGDTFAWSDFPWYFLGCGAGWIWLRWLAPHRSV